MEDIEAKLACGIDRVIIGTKAVSDSEFVKRAVDKYGKKSLSVLTQKTVWWLSRVGKNKRFYCS